MSSPRMIEHQGFAHQCANGMALIALIISRIIVTCWPAGLPVPRLILAVQPAPEHIHLFQLFSYQEFHHER